MSIVENYSNGSFSWQNRLNIKIVSDEPLAHSEQKAPNVLFIHLLHVGYWGIVNKESVDVELLSETFFLQVECPLHSQDGHSEKCQFSLQISPLEPELVPSIQLPYPVLSIDNVSFTLSLLHQPHRSSIMHDEQLVYCNKQALLNATGKMLCCCL